MSRKVGLRLGRKAAALGIREFSWRRAAAMVSIQGVLACAFLAWAGAVVSPNAMLAGFGVEMLALYWLVGWLFWSARAAVADSYADVASNPTEEVAEPVSGQMKPVKVVVAFAKSTG